jgi:hypothetical protein
MPIQELTAAEIESLVGTRHGVTGVEYPANGLQPYYQWLMRSLHLLSESASLSAGLRVSRDTGSPTTVRIAPGRAAIDGAAVAYAGGTLDLAAHDNATAYVWLKTGGTIGSGASGGGWPFAAHLKLAEVTLASGEITAMIDRRAESVSRPPLSLGGCPLLDGRFVRAMLQAPALGDHDLGPVPAGKRWSVLGYTAVQTGGANSSHFVQLKASSTYYRLSATSTLGDGTATVSVTLPGIVLDAGESLSVNVGGSIANTNFFLSVFETSSSTPLRSAKVLAIAATETAIYTCPAGRTALLLDAGLQPNGITSRLNYVNASGGSQTVKWHVVPAGGSVAASNQLTPSLSVANGARSTANAPGLSLQAGDSIVVVTSNTNAGQSAWVNILEL